MKNAIYYFYQMTSYDIHKNNKNYFFKSSVNKYALIHTELPIEIIEKVKKISFEMLKSGLISNELIYNKTNSIVTNIDGINYVLMRYYVNRTNTININDVLAFTNNSYSVAHHFNREINWKTLWSDKIDYMEYQILNFGKKNKIIRESFSYYVGLGENAICLLNNITNNIYLSVQHKRMTCNYTYFDLYNPLNYIIDSRVRDICEYIKSRFFNNVKFGLNDELKNLIINQHYTHDEYILFFSRIMFPTYYFDLFEKIVVDNEETSKIKKIINKVQEFEIFLKNLYIYLCHLTEMPDIEWLKK